MANLIAPKRHLGTRRLQLEALERRDLLAKLLPLAHMVAGQMTRFAGEFVHSDPTQEPPAASHSCDPGFRVPIRYGRFVDSFQLQAPGDDSREAIGNEFHFDPQSGVESLSNLVQVGGGVDYIDEYFMLNVFGTVNMDSYEVLEEDQWRACSRLDRSAFSAGGMGALQVVPTSLDEQIGDAVAIEAYASVTQLVNGEPLGDPAPSVDANATFSYYSGGASFEATATDDETPGELEGVIRIGDVFSFSLGITGDLKSEELYAWSNITASAGGHVFLRELEPLAVTSKEIASNGPTFKDYLPGVKLEETFTVAIDEGAAHQVKQQGVSVAFADPQLTAFNFVRVPDSNLWTFQVNLGAGVDDTEFTVTVTYEGGGTQRYRGTVDYLEEPLQLELSMRPGMTAALRLPVDQLRLIHDVPLLSPGQFRATIAGIQPRTRQAYRDRIDLVHVTPSGARSVFRPTVLFGATNDFDKSISVLSALTAGTHRFELAPAAGFATRSVILSNAESLDVINVPAWMAPFATSVVAANGGELAAALGIEGAAGYRMELDFPNLQRPWSKVVEPGGFTDAFVKLLNGHFETKIDAGLRLTAYASLSHTVSGKIIPTDWRIEAVVAGKTLIPRSAKKIQPGVKGILDGRTLNLVELRYQDTINLKSLFGIESFSYSIPPVGTPEAKFAIPIPAFPAVEITLGLTGELSGDVTQLDLAIDLGLTLHKGRLYYSSSSLELIAKAYAELTADLEAGISCIVCPDSLTIATVSGSVRLDVEASLKLLMIGPVFSATSVRLDPTSDISIKSSIDFDWKGVCLREEPCKEGETIEDDKAGFGLDDTLEAAKDAAAAKAGDLIEGAADWVIDSSEMMLPTSRPGRVLAPATTPRGPIARDKATDQYFDGVDSAAVRVPIQTSRQLEKRHAVAAVARRDRSSLQTDPDAAKLKSDAISAVLDDFITGGISRAKVRTSSTK